MIADMPKVLTKGKFEKCSSSMSVVQDFKQPVLKVLKDFYRLNTLL